MPNVINLYNRWATNTRRAGSKDGFDYSTLKNDLNYYKTVGNKFEILPRDNFNFVPATGYGTAQALKDSMKQENADKAGGLRKLAEEDPHAIIDGFENAALWAKTHLKNVNVQANKAPIPNENLVGKELIVEASKQLIEEQEFVVACHVIERLELDDYIYACHVARNVGVIEVTVSPHGLPNTLYAACHDIVNPEPFCHILNPHDTVFVT